MNGRLAARENQPLGTLSPTVQDLLLHFFGVAHAPVVRLAVETEDAVVVAVEGQPHPVSLLVRGLFVLLDPATAVGFCPLLFREHA